MELTNQEQKQPEKIENILSEIRTQEESLPVAEKDPKSNRLKKALIALTAGLTLFSVSPDFARANERPNEKQQIEIQMQELQQKLDSMKQKESEKKHEEQEQEVQGWLDSYFNIKGLKLGQPEARMRCP